MSSRSVVSPGSPGGRCTVPGRAQHSGHRPPSPAHGPGEQHQLVPPSRDLAVPAVGPTGHRARPHPPELLWVETPEEGWARAKEPSLSTTPELDEWDLRSEWGHGLGEVACVFAWIATGSTGVRPITLWSVSMVCPTSVITHRSGPNSPGFTCRSSTCRRGRWVWNGM